VAGDSAPAAEMPPAVPFHVDGLRRRTDFLAASRARRASTPGFTLQARARAHEEPDAHAIRVGFTCSRKVGNAVARNRARRRLREATRIAMPEAAVPGADHIFIARRMDAERPFEDLVRDTRHALAKARRKLAGNR